LVGATKDGNGQLTVFQGTEDGPRLWAGPRQTFFAPNDDGPGQFGFASVAGDFDADGHVELATAVPFYEAPWEGP
jgi:hypothetical protein